MAPPAAASLWKSMNGYKLSTGDKYSVQDQLLFHNEGFTDYLVDFTLDLVKFETIFGAQCQHVSYLSLYLHTDKDDFVGFARSAIRGDRVWVCGLAVAPAFRSKGIGAFLVREYLNLLRELSKVQRVQLECIKENNRAVKLYARMGFQTNFDMQDYAIEELQSLPDPSSKEWTLSTSDQVDASLPWLQHRLIYSWQRELSTLLNSCRSIKQCVVREKAGQLVLGLAVETAKDPARITGFAFEQGSLSSADLANGIRAALHDVAAERLQVAFEPESSEVIPLLEGIEGCKRTAAFEEHHMILSLERS